MTKSIFTTSTYAPGASVSGDQWLNEMIALVGDFTAKLRDDTDKDHPFSFPLLRERGPDLLFSRDVYEALLDRCGVAPTSPLDGMWGIPIGVRSDIPAGYVVAGSERGRRIIREMKEAAGEAGGDDVDRV